MTTFNSLFTNARLGFAVGLLIAGLSASTASFAADATVKKTDKAFIKSAYQDGLAEIHMGELGQSKSSNADLKAFAAKIVADHTKANSELKTLAESKNVEVAKDPTLLEQGKAKLLDAKSGADFDKAFAEDMVSDHKKAIAAFEKESSSASDPDVKAFAKNTLPILQGHLTMAEDLQNKVGK